MRDQRRIPGEIRDIDEILKDFFSNLFLFLRCYFLFSFCLWFPLFLLEAEVILAVFIAIFID